eukprot:TRINITY_DN14293_c0_g2_i1.p1 TRINITY_DN14293_c0_g2~~TRINITY_DN14293_c0_g2_i1.p1  ORF type:complete len:623 (+),score=106.46 TRINITY_DN14293_c0_g2_i1:57-1871(+)
MPALEAVKGADEEPALTRSQMIVLLDPLHSCLQRIEANIQELSRNAVSPSGVDNFGASTALSLFPTLPEAPSGVEPSEDAKATSEVRPNGDADAKSNVECTSPTSPTSSNRETPQNMKKLRRKPSGRLEDVGKTDMLDRKMINKVLYGEKLGLPGDAFWHRIYHAVESFLLWWNFLEEPERHGRLYQFTKSSYFNTLTIMAILANAVLIAISADWQMRNIDAQKPPPLLEAMEVGFMVFFSVELAIRLAAHGLYFFVNQDMAWNIFDLMLVLFSVIDAIIRALAHDELSGNVVFIRLVRLFKTARMLRSLRSFKFFKELLLMLESFQKSLYSLFWTFVMLGFVLYVLALIFMQALVEYRQFSEVDSDTETIIVKRFGSFWAAVISLYMSVTGGENWVVYYEVFNKVGPVYGFIFTLYTFLFLFAIFNIVTASLVEKSMSSIRIDRAEEILTHRKTILDNTRGFRALCQSISTCRHGHITQEEFREWMENPVMLAYLGHLGLDVHDADLFFQLVLTHSRNHGKSAQADGISIDAFVDGCMRLRGSAASLDMHMQMIEMRSVNSVLQKIDASVASMAQAIGRSERCAAAPASNPELKEHGDGKCML